MDYLSRCYSARVRPFRDSTEEVNIRWFFCADGAQIFPGTHLFGSQVWRPEKDIEPDQAGELYGQKQYDPGFNFGYPGKCLVGPLEWFQQGIPSADVPSSEPPIPPCCLSPLATRPGSKVGFRGVDIGAPGFFWGSRTGLVGASNRTSVGQWGSGGAWDGTIILPSKAQWGDLTGWAGSSTHGYAAQWGLRGSWMSSAQHAFTGQWGERGSWRGPMGYEYVAQWGNQSIYCTQCGVYVCRLQRLAALSVPVSAHVVIPWDTELTDNGNMFSSATPTRITAPSDGVYLATLTIPFPSGSAAATWQVQLNVNGSPLSFNWQLPFGVAGTWAHPAVKTLLLKRGDYLEWTVEQTSGGTQTISFSDYHAPAAEVTYLGPLL